MEIPQTLFYATVLYTDGRQVTPPYFVFEKFPEGVTMLRHYYEDREQEIESLIVKELKFIETKVLPDEASILIPHTDDTIAEEPSQEEQEDKVIQAEAEDPSESIMVVFPEEQENEDLLCRSFYMGPFMKAESVEDLTTQLITEPFVTALPIDYVWLYRPTGEMKAVKL